MYLGNILGYVGMIVGDAIGIVVGYFGGMWAWYWDVGIVTLI